MWLWWKCGKWKCERVDRIGDSRQRKRMNRWIWVENKFTTFPKFSNLKFWKHARLDNNQQQVTIHKHDFFNKLYNPVSNDNKTTVGRGSLKTWNGDKMNGICSICVNRKFLVLSTLVWWWTCFFCVVRTSCLMIDVLHCCWQCISASKYTESETM